MSFLLIRKVSDIIASSSGPVSSSVSIPTHSIKQPSIPSSVSTPAKDKEDLCPMAVIRSDAEVLSTKLDQETMAYDKVTYHDLYPSRRP